MAGWATAGDVTTLTGVTAFAFQVEQANAVIELHAGRIYDPVNTPLRVGAHDIEWMRRAAAYQAAWMVSQPDVFARLDLTEVPVGTSTPVKTRETAMTLAPLARRALKRVSWLKSRSVHVRSAFQDGLGPISGAVIDYDDVAGW